MTHRNLNGLSEHQQDFNYDMQGLSMRQMFKQPYHSLEPGNWVTPQLWMLHWCNQAKSQKQCLSQVGETTLMYVNPEKKNCRIMPDSCGAELIQEWTWQQRGRGQWHGCPGLLSTEGCKMSEKWVLQIKKFTFFCSTHLKLSFKRKYLKFWQ